MRHAEDPEPLIAEGRWHGEIIDTPQGENGFGYDPHFYVPTLAQAPPSLPRRLKTHIAIARLRCVHWLPASRNGNDKRLT